MRETFLALVVGLTMTCFFFAYENVFYIIANKLGAWAPRDVGYSDLLSTAFPWVYVLFVGWLPAITEEFISRMFSIPFFERAGALLRLPAAVRLPLAMLVAAVIWGFGHAAYPNQPWWIRGLEVGLAGIVFGLAFMRFGILSVLVCHFSVDALYTAFVMIRSGNPYYVVSGTLCAGACAILLLVALALYVSRGGFLPAETTNAQEGSAPPLPPAPVRDAAQDPARDYRRLPLLVAAGGILAACGLAALSFVPVHEFGDWADFKITKQRAHEAAESFLRTQGTTCRRIGGRRHGRLHRRRRGGLSSASRAAWTSRRRSTANGCRCRSGACAIFVPGAEGRVRPSGSIASPAPRSWSSTAPCPTMRPVRASSRARRWPSRRRSRRAWDWIRARDALKEQSQKDEKARRDHTLVWEYPIPDGGEARVRHTLVVQGDRVGSWTRSVKIPEGFERARTAMSAGPAIHLTVAVLLGSMLAALAIVIFVRLLRSGEIPWRFALVSGAVAGAASCLGVALATEKMWASTYDTAMPAGIFPITIVVVIGFSFVLALLGVALVVGIAGGLFSAVPRMFSLRSRRAYAADALVAGCVAVGIALAIPVLRALVVSAIPSGRLISGIDVPIALDSRVPYLEVLLAALRRTSYLPAVGGVLLGLLFQYFRSLPLRAGLAILAVFVFTPMAVRTLPELLAAGVANGVVLAAAALFARFFLRDNPLAWAWSCWLALGVASALTLAEMSAPLYRRSGLIALAFVLAPGLVLVIDALAGRKRSTGGGLPDESAVPDASADAGVRDR